MKIYSVKPNSLNEADRLELARLLVKAGYTVRVGSEKVPNGKSNSSAYFVEYFERGKSDAQEQN